MVGMHAGAHLDEVKPEGVENEAVEQVAFADRILMNKIDLVDEDALAALERRIRQINATTEFIRVKNCSEMGDGSPLDLKRILGVHAFDLDSVLKVRVCCVL